VHIRGLFYLCTELYASHITAYNVLDNAYVYITTVCVYTATWPTGVATALEIFYGRRLSIVHLIVSWWFGALVALFVV